MDTLAVICFRCQTPANAVSIGDGTYLYTCGSKGCQECNHPRIVMLTECAHCGLPMTGYEQERPPHSPLPRIFMATCRNPKCNKRGLTKSVSLPEKVVL